MFSNKKQGSRITIAGLFLLASCITSCLVLTVSAAGQETAAPITLPAEEVCFTLNGSDFPRSPVLQDFLDRGWKQGKWCSKTGDYDEAAGPYNVVVSGYYLTNGDSRIVAQLNEDDCRNGLGPNACRVKSIDFCGDPKASCHAESLCIDGIEYTTTTDDELKTYAPSARTILSGAVEYDFSLAEKGISTMLVNLSPDDSVGQILVVFDHYA